MTQETRFCVDCKHCYKNPWYLFRENKYECKHEKNMLFDDIDGKRYINNRISFCRVYLNACSKDGNWFERKEKKK